MAKYRVQTADEDAKMLLSYGSFDRLVHAVIYSYGLASIAQQEPGLLGGPAPGLAVAEEQPDGEWSIVWTYDPDDVDQRKRAATWAKLESGAFFHPAVMSGTFDRWCDERGIARDAPDAFARFLAEERASLRRPG